MIFFTGRVFIGCLSIGCNAVAGRGVTVGLTLFIVAAKWLIATGACCRRVAGSRRISAIAPAIAAAMPARIQGRVMILLSLSVLYRRSFSEKTMSGSG